MRMVCKLAPPFTASCASDASIHVLQPARMAWMASRRARNDEQDANARFARRAIRWQNYSQAITLKPPARLHGRIHANSQAAPGIVGPFAGLDVPWLLRMRAETRRDHPFLIWAPFDAPARSWTYGEFHERVGALAAGLPRAASSPANMS